MTPDALDRELYYWIQVANESRERFLLPIGLIEDSIARVKLVFGEAYLSNLLEKTKQPIGLLVTEEVIPLRIWLGSPGVDKHVIQVLEFSTLLKTFQRDLHLHSKMEKLKKDSFHPVFFELAMAYRLKKSAAPDGDVRLCAEDETAVGDFTLQVAGNLVACECSRLTFGPAEEVQFKILDLVYDYIADFAKTKPGKRLIKIKLTEPLAPQVYNPRLLVRLKKAINHFDRTSKQTRATDQTIEVQVEALSSVSEKIPFEYKDGRVMDALGTSWTTALSIGDIVGHTEREVAEMYRQGVKMEPEEHTRVLVEFPRAESDYDPYKRLRQRINDKVKQTKLSEKYFGKLIFIECPFDLWAADHERIQRIAEAELRQSSNTLGIFLCKREANPHYRHHYSMIGHLNSAASKALPCLGPVFERFQVFDTKLDPITGEPYVLTWAEASNQAAKRAEIADG
jgi:hypothetical protein